MYSYELWEIKHITTFKLSKEIPGLKAIVGIVENKIEKNFYILLSGLSQAIFQTLRL